LQKAFVSFFVQFLLGELAQFVVGVFSNFPGFLFSIRVSRQRTLMHKTV